MVSEEELISQLEKKALRVTKQTTHDIPGTTDTYTFYTVYWLEGKIIKSEAVCVYIDGETKEAYWKDRIPTILAPLPITTFRDRVKSEIKTFLDTHPEVEVINIISVNEEEKNAILQAFCAIETESEEKRILVYEKADKIKFKFLR